MNNSWAFILACQWVLIIVEPLLICVPMEMLTSCKGIHIHQYVIGGTGLYWNVGTSSVCQAYSTVSITSKEFTKFQIVLRTWNPSVKLEIHCAFIRSPINCICNIDFLWSKFPVEMLYSLSSKVKLFKGLECLTNSFNVHRQCLFYPAFLLLASSSSISFEPLFFLLLFCCFSGYMCSSLADIW